MSLSPVFYEFGRFRIDMQRYLLLRDDEPVPLSPKAFKTLLVLVENRDRVVLKEELLNAIWPDSYVEESNLAQNVFVLRKALGEEKSDHRYIVTLPGTGYRFVAQVRELGGKGLPQDSTLNENSLAISSIAVLPFRPLVEEGSDKFLGLGLTDALVTKLSSLKQIKVRPTIFVLRYRDATSDLISIGRELNVDAFLDGVFQRDGDQIRVSVQLVRVRDGTTLWAAKFDESFTNLFSIQDSISEQVVRALALELSIEERRQLAKSYTDSTDAFQLYIRGRYFWNQRTLEGLRKSIDYAQQAIAMDPTYAPAYVGLADAYNLLAGHGGLAPRETFPKAKAAAMRAIEVDSGLAEAYASLGFVNYRFEWDWREAEKNFRQAIELKPNYATGHHWFGECLAAMGRFEESLAALRRAQECDPLSLPINTDLAQTLYFARRYAECEAVLHETLEFDRHFARAYIVLGTALEQLGKYDEAVAALTRALELTGESHLALSGLGHVYAISGRKKAARETIRSLEQVSHQHYVSAYNIAIIHTGLGEKEEALARLREAVDKRDVWLVWLASNPRLDPLREDSRFSELLSSVGLLSAA